MSHQQTQPKQKKKRSGSETRQRQSIIGVRVYDDERARIDANASAADLCASSYLRVLGTSEQRARERRRPLPELKPFTRAMGRFGIYMSNHHQLLKLANRGEIPEVEELRQVATKIDAVADELLKILRG
jgi:hypothetical protein